MKSFSEYIKIMEEKTQKIGNHIEKSFLSSFSNKKELYITLSGSISLILGFLGFFINANWSILPIIALVITSIYGWLNYQEITAKWLMFLTTIFTILILGLITSYLLIKSIPVISHMGIESIIKLEPPYWNVGNGIFSLTPMIWGTFLTTMLAMLIAAPLGIIGAIFISEISPPRLRDFFKPSVEVLAGIPSIVYGYLGYVVLNQYMMKNLNLTSYGSLFIAGLVIGVMALPTVVSVSEDAITAVPDAVKDGSVALGLTDWQTLNNITLPAAISGITSATLLGVGRAVGETMAATVILGHAQVLPKPLYDIFGNTETLTSLIASQYGHASPGEMHLKALFLSGLFLFVVILLISIISQRIEIRMKRKLEGKE
ncbi:MAG: ABC-type phosphate transport system permease component [Candidatus Methanohalarchaeum thermophilum]|uniref:Phosphate transport system permease protein n=1 Tax=Methanohalarchaeum thermophilum TaxID=1903181 RepID=A0A1Q6DTI1_METT1|nr:MAG: ABC-type phosphate transport system permease component [Candidatus Methanohalarchaeum thermophilum]